MLTTRRKYKLLGAISLAGVTFAAGAAHADFFDAIGRIFGGQPTPPPQVQTYTPDPFYDEGPRSAPLDMTVRPRRAPTRQVVKKPVRIETPVETVSMDPVKNPDWFLNDPTLRRGDIIVLKGEVLVFEGGSSGQHSRAEFSSLSRSSLPPADKQRLREMAGLQMPTVTASAPQSAKAKPNQVTAMASAQSD